MSCYFRHMKDILDKAGIDLTPGNRKQIDRAIHQIVGVAHKDCPAAWKRLKEQIGDEQRKQELATKLRNAMSRLPG